MNEITMKMHADQLIRMALQEDITSEDVSTNAVMPTATKGTVDLIAKEDGVIAGLDIYARVFTKKLQIRSLTKKQRSISTVRTVMKSKKVI